MLEDIVPESKATYSSMNCQSLVDVSPQTQHVTIPNFVWNSIELYVGILPHHYLPSDPYSEESSKAREVSLPVERALIHHLDKE